MWTLLKPVEPPAGTHFLLASSYTMTAARAWQILCSLYGQETEKKIIIYYSPIKKHMIKLHIYSTLSLQCVRCVLLHPWCEHWAAVQEDVTDCREGNSQLFIAWLLLKLLIPEQNRWEESSSEIWISVHHCNTDNFNSTKRERGKERNRRRDSEKSMKRGQGETTRG